MVLKIPTLLCAPHYGKRNKGYSSSLLSLHSSSTANRRRICAWSSQESYGPVPWMLDLPPLLREPHFSPSVLVLVFAGTLPLRCLFYHGRQLTPFPSSTIYHPPAFYIPLLISWVDAYSQGVAWLMTPLIRTLEGALVWTCSLLSIYYFH